MKKCFLLFRRIPLCFSLRVLPLDLPLSTSEKSLAPSSLNPPSDSKTGGSLGYSDHTPVEFTLLRNMGQGKSKVRTMNFRETNFQLFEELVNRTPWENAFRYKGAEQSWQIFRVTFLGAQELLISICQKSG